MRDFKSAGMQRTGSISAEKFNLYCLVNFYYFFFKIFNQKQRGRGKSRYLVKIVNRILIFSSVSGIHVWESTDLVRLLNNRREYFN